MSIDTESLPMESSLFDRRMIFLILSWLALPILALCALRFGFRETTLAEIWQVITNYNALNANHVVISEIRFPRIVGAVLAGSALGVAGALMQGMTRNPLADPGLLGVNAGASIGVVISIWVLGLSDPSSFVWAALIGGLIAALLVFSLGGVANGTPARLILAGAAISALFLALTRGLLLVSQQTLDVYRFWVLGGFDGIQLTTIEFLLPFFAVGFMLSVFATFTLNALMLGTDTARSLGVRVGASYLIIGLAIVILCGATVSMAGPIAFVGLIVPHLARWIAGPDMRWMVVFSACFGAGLLVCADMLGRLALFGGNMQAGVMSALIGGPVLIWLVRRNGVLKL